MVASAWPKAGVRQAQKSHFYLILKTKQPHYLIQIMNIKRLLGIASPLNTLYKREECPSEGY
jgi:hypothetical protein